MPRAVSGSTPMADVDAANLALESGQPNVITLAGLLAPGGFVDSRGEPDVAALRDALAPRIRSVPALNRAPENVDGAWSWREVAPDLSHHIRLIPPDSAFEETCARVIVQPLASGRPLWEMLLVPHAEDDRCGLLFRLHHAVADGMGAEELIAAIADPMRTAGPGAVTAGPPHQAAPPRRRPLVHRAADIAAQTLAVFRRSVDSRVLLGPLGPTRDVAFVDVDLQRLHDGARLLGGTVGDAFLAAFGRGLGALLIAAGEEPPVTVPVSCPVRITRQQGEGNATGVMLIPVPVAPVGSEDDISGRVARVAAVTRSEKVRARAAGTFHPMRSPRAARLLMRFAQRQRAVGAIASELTGPSRTLRLAGSELVAAWPLALLSGNVRVGALGVSYAGRFRVSIQTEADHLPTARVVAESMATALDRIAAAPQESER
ncbi:wax ester/triacylglycerol synthase domain-containing protein [Leifsonia poae]|uniref:wax ester/triacylglycerol synthase domain-containing protein n=1 Tax=Leifsonia poae TaxID=110933 RepID=UPI003D68DA62